jgi:hypothetical protein
VDALRLAAIFLAHWDNKASNQRLVCTQFTPDTPADGDARRCQDAVAYLQDLGATFGPNKIDLHGWEQAPIWVDASACRVSMRSFPYGGGTFRDVSISEAGRQLLANRLTALSRDRVRSLFKGARASANFTAAVTPPTWSDGPTCFSPGRRRSPTAARVRRSQRPTEARRALKNRCGRRDADGEAARPP